MAWEHCYMFSCLWKSSSAWQRFHSPLGSISRCVPQDIQPELVLQGVQLRNTLPEILKSSCKNLFRFLVHTIFQQTYYTLILHISDSLHCHGLTMISLVKVMNELWLIIYFSDLIIVYENKNIHKKLRIHVLRSVSKCILGLKYKNMHQREIWLNLETTCNVEIHIFNISEKNTTVELRDSLQMPLRNVSYLMSVTFLLPKQNK